METFKIIYADPPWSYRDKCHAGKRGAGYKYPVMNTSDIKRLDVQSLADKDCTLFLWATMPMLPDAIEVAKAWGFTYKTVGFVWVKTNRKSNTDFFGMGNWTRANAELCLIATRGKPKRVSACVRQIVSSPVLAHSEKPSDVRDRIVMLMGDLPRVELFARHQTPGWKTWGNAVPNDIVMTVIPNHQP